MQKIRVRGGVLERIIATPGCVDRGVVVWAAGCSSGSKYMGPKIDLSCCGARPACLLTNEAAIAPLELSIGQVYL